jgi:hypothetical protein
MKYLLFALLFLTACAHEEQRSHPWPNKITKLEKGILVKHSLDTVYATLNTKDPNTHGKFQLQFTTTVSSLEGDIKVEEFGAYFWDGTKWKATSIYNRPFNPEEFDKWYKGDNGFILEGKNYSDNDNWLAKGNVMSGDTINTLLYFMGYNEQNEKVVGASEIVGVLSVK